MSRTPLTDAAIEVDCVGDDFSPLKEFCRELERENNRLDACLNNLLREGLAQRDELTEVLRDILRIAKAASIGITGNAKRIERAEIALANHKSP